MDTPQLTILPPEAKILDVSEQPGCGVRNYGGLGRPGINLTSSSSSEQFYYQLSFAHELAHQIHFKVKNTHPEFDEKWAMIKGGYAQEYGMTDQMEDIATVVDVAIKAFIEGQDLRQIKPIDGNYEAFHKKLRLLKEYGFFPEALKVP